MRTAHNTPESEIPKDADGNRFIAGRYYRNEASSYVYLACKTGYNSDPLNITLFLAQGGDPHQHGHQFNMGRLDLLARFRRVPGPQDLQTKLKRELQKAEYRLNHCKALALEARAQLVEAAEGDEGRSSALPSTLILHYKARAEEDKTQTVCAALRALLRDVKGCKP